MNVKITPSADNSQIMEFNMALPDYGNTSLSPVSTLTLTQRWASIVNTGTEETPEYVQITKFDAVITTQYTDCNGASKIVVNKTSTVFSTPATTDTVTTLVPEVFKAVDIIIPSCVGIVNQAILNELPTSVETSGKCVYSVFYVTI
jgi:hypothetical protein